MNVFFFFVTLIILALLSRSLPVVTQIRDHLAGPPPPFPPRHVPSFLSTRRIRRFRPSSTRVESCLHAARRSQQVYIIARCTRRRGTLYGRGESSHGWGAPDSKKFLSSSRVVLRYPPNFSLTKSPVSKPAPGRISHATRCLSTPSPTSSIVRPLHTRNYMDTLFSIVSLLVSSSHDDDDETFVKENRWFGRGLIVESV